MDPLSITAGVVGLVATATKISATLSEVCTSVSDAPESARAVLAAVETTRLSLNSIKHLFDTISTLPSERKALIRLDHIAVTCSQCVLTLSELESLVCGELVKNGPASSMLTRIKWTWNEKKVLSFDQAGGAKELHLAHDKCLAVVPAQLAIDRVGQLSLTPRQSILGRCFQGQY